MHPLVERYVQGQMPEPMIQALLGGSLPLPAHDLLEALAHAIYRRAPFFERAEDTLRTLPESQLASAIVGPVSQPGILGVILAHRREPTLLEQALLHEDLTAVVVEEAVSRLPGSVLDIVLNNQVLWIERPGILDAVEEHPEADYNAKRRITEFRFHVLQQIPEEVAAERNEILDEVKAGRLDVAWSTLPIPAEKPNEGDLDEGEKEEDENAIRERLLKPILDADGKEVPLTLTQRVMKLRTNQKIMLAIKGGKEERTLLIREANRLIQVNVIRNPRITESEIAYIAQMRTVNEEVLRIISMSREWMKKYTIYKNLVLNPRTPIAIAMSNFKRLQEPDLKLLMKDKNVPEMLRRETKRYLDAKTSGGRG